eukprot:1181472-Prymnesium_polylepis.1
MPSPGETIWRARVLATVIWAAAVAMAYATMGRLWGGDMERRVRRSIRGATMRLRLTCGRAAAVRRRGVLHSGA